MASLFSMGTMGYTPETLPEAQDLTNLDEIKAVAENLPGLGELLSAYDAKQAYDAGDYWDAVISGVGAVPLVGPPIKKTVKAYKLFRKKGDKLYPLFINADVPVPIGKWLPAEIGRIDPETGKVIGGSSKATKGSFAPRPGWHAGEFPVAKHIGTKANPTTGDKLSRKEATELGITSPTARNDNEVWAEVEMPADVDWQAEALSRAKYKKDGTLDLSTADIRDQIPEGGYYRFKTNPNMEGDWLIGGALKVNRILDDAEVKAINDAAGVADLPRVRDLKKNYAESLKKDEIQSLDLDDDLFTGGL